jgi:hypothetical protein
MNIRVFIIVLVFNTFNAFSSKAQTVDQFNSWWMYFGNHRISDKIGLHTEYQFRRSDFGSEWQQSLARIGVDYYLPNKTMVTAGYGWIVSFPYGEQPIDLSFNEHRIWQQLILQQNTGRFYFHHRYRLEQRFLENVSRNTAGEKVTDGFRFRQRARYRFLVTVPLTRNTLSDNTLFFAAYDEPFLGFGKGIQRNILDQNRLYFALGWRFNANTNVQLGYLNHYVIKGNGDLREDNHTLQVGLTHNMDFRTKA